MKIRVYNPTNLPLIDYRKVQPLQGDLKDLTRENYDRLLNILKKRGFRVPFFLWHNTETGRRYFMDGHQRHRLMTGENITDESGSYEFPYVLIEAANEREAREILLEITGQYGTITQEGFDRYLGELQAFEDFDYDDTVADLYFDALLVNKAKSGDEEKEKEDKKEKAPSGPTFSLELNTKEDCLQAKQVIKDFAERTGEEPADIFINILEAGAEKMLADMGY